METVVRVEQDAIDCLAEMGLDAEILRRAVLAGEMAADTCTDLDPPGFRGYTQWGVCTRELRAGLAPDWTPRNRQNLPLAVSPDGAMCITVSIGDPATGVENATPQTKNPRGRVTLSAIRENAGPFVDDDGAVRESAHLYIPTLEGPHVAALGDWIVCGIKGEFYPVKPDIFDLTYQPERA